MLGVAISALWGSQPGYAKCSPESVDEYASVQTIVDGDTVRLTNRKLVRLIGINTPEIGYEGAVSEPLAHTARQFLTELLNSHQRIALVYEADTQDRHGRWLAHVFVRDDDSWLNAQQLILENGLAFWIAIPPNTGFLECYQAAEAIAQKQRLGIWNDAYFQPKNAADISALSPGFQMLQGTISAAFKAKNSYWLKFNDTVALRISNKDIHNFHLSVLNALNGKTVLARGWLYRHKNRLTMQLRHPDSINLQP